MSGPITTPGGNDDLITWNVDGHGQPMVSPVVSALHPLTPPDYYTGPLPYYGDFQLTPNGSGPMVLVLHFDRPIKSIRTTAQFVGASGMAMYAVVDAGDFGGGGTFTSPKFATWQPGVSGTRTVTHEAGFSYVVLQTLVTSPSSGSAIFGPTFRNTMFFEEITPVQAFEPFEPGLHVPRGAARTLSFHWPPVTFDAPDPPSSGITVRPQFLPTLGHMTTVDVGVQAGNSQVSYRNKRALRVAGTATTGRYFAPAFGASKPYQILIQTEPSNRANIKHLDEIGWWQVEANLAFEQPSGPVTRDVGLTLGSGLNRDVRGANTQAGVQFGLRGIDSLGLTVRQATGGAITYEKLYDLPSGFDVEDWHNYKLRIGSSNFGTDALLKVLLDDVVIDTLPWDGATVLPPIQEGVNLGFCWAVGNQGGGADFTTRMYIAQGGVALIAASTEDGLA